MTTRLVSLVCLALLAATVTHGFAPSRCNSKASRAMTTTTTTTTTLLQASAWERNIGGTVAAAVLALNVITAAPTAAVAGDKNNNFGSQELLAARSGGRAGGRAGGGSYSRSSYSRPSAPRTTYRSSTTIVRPMISSPPIVISPFGGGYGYGYGNPMGGFGLGYGLGAINSAGDSMRDYRQESEIQKSKAELEQAKTRELELEQRIKALEEVNKGTPAKATPQQ